MFLYFKRFLQFLRECTQHFQMVNGSVKAAALSYATLLSLVPVTVLSLGFIIAFPTYSAYFEELHRFLYRHFIPSSANLIQNYVTQFASNATNLSATGLIFFLVSSVLLIFTMETVFNAIWQVRQRRKGLKAFFMYWSLLTLIPPIGGLGVAFSVFLSGSPYWSAAMDMLSVFVPYIFTFSSYLLLYVAIPNCTVLFRHAAFGASIAALAFEITKEAFRIYVSNFSADVIIYGVLSVFPIFLLWLYVSWLITLIGAVIAHRSSVHADMRKEHAT